MSGISKKLKLHRGSDLWNIRSDVIGKKAEAQKDLDKILSALKLQELVKEKINQERPKFDGLVSEETYKNLQRQYHSTALTLQSLVKESENTVKEKGNEGTKN